MNTDTNTSLPLPRPAPLTVLDTGLIDKCVMEMRCDQDGNLFETAILIFDEEALDGDYVHLTVTNNAAKLRQMAAWLLEAAKWTEDSMKRNPITD